MQQTLPNQHATTTTPAHTLTLSWELIAYAVLVFLMTIFLLADSDIMPLSDAEATRALATWHAFSDRAGQATPPPDSPLLFIAHQISYSTLGITEFSTRIMGTITALALIVMIPILARSILGKRPAFILTLVFACSPAVILSARSADPMLFTLISALVWLWALYQHWHTRQSRHLTIAAVAFASLFFLSAPYAPIFFLMIVVSFIIAYLWAFPTQSDADPADIDHPLQPLRLWLTSWNLLHLTLIMLATVFILATNFMLHPSGLAHVAHLLQQSLTFEPVTVPTGLIIIVYDALFVMLAFIGALLAFYRTEFNLLQRFAFVWLLIALVTITLFNLPPASLLWLLPPSAVLITYLVDLCLQPMADDTYNFIGTLDADAFIARYGWVKWVVALIVGALTLLLSFHWQIMARNLLALPLETNLTNAFPILLEPLFIQFRYSFVWLLIGILFLIVGFFLLASLWGTRNTWQGYGLGVFAFALLSGLGGAYNASAVPARTAEAWHTPFTHPDYTTLRQTLIEVAQRDTSGFTTLPITVVVDDMTTIDPLILWALRDFNNAHYTPHIDDAARQQIILTTHANLEPELGGSYVGQSFTIRTYWSPDTLQSWDIFAWLTNRRIRPLDLPRDTVILWLRQDVFEGVPPAIRPQS